MAKKKRCRSKRTSKAQRESISSSITRLVKASRSEGDKFINKLNAWKKGKKGYVTVSTGDPSRPYVKITFEQHFGGLYKDVKHRVRPAAEDKDRVEI
jgi:hypothetical protein